MHPDFTGTWRLIRGESDFAFLAPPRLRVDTIDHNGERLRIRTRQKDSNGDLTIERDLTLGGDPVIVTIHGRARHIRAFGDGTALVIETISEVSGNVRRIQDQFSLDDSGEWMTIERRFEQPGGAVHQRLRLRRLNPSGPKAA